jgi:hypothetical protein
MTREEILKMSAGGCCDWLKEKNAIVKEYSTSMYDRCGYYNGWNLAACAFAVRDYLVQENLILQWTQELDQVREFPWDKNPIDWLRAAVMVLNEKEMKK